MANTLKKTKIFPYDHEWPKIFGEEAKKIKDFLGTNCIATYHIGSTSVSGLAAKKDIDILLIINDLKKSLMLEQLGYIFKGEVNIPLRYFFSKNTKKSRVNLHACEPNHGFIELNLAFRDFLREHKEEAAKYAKLKYKVVKSHDSGKKINQILPLYNLRKNSFIKSVLKKSGYKGLMVNFCAHDKEWSEYHRIKKEQLFKNKENEYNENYPDLHSDNHYHFCMYKGADIVAIAHVEFLVNNRYELKALSIDTPYQNQEISNYLLGFIKRWVNNKIHTGVVEI